jgi:hypothetical protein
MTPVDSIEFSRDIHMEENRCSIEDRIWGDLKGKTLLFSCRGFSNALIEVRGLHKRQSVTGWGSDGRQELKLYEVKNLKSEFSYQFIVRALPEDSR